MPPIRSCPPPALFRTLLDGMLSPEDEARLGGHVEICTGCQLVLEQMNQSLQEGLRLGPPAPLTPLDESLRQAMHSLKVSPPGLLTVDFVASDRALVSIRPDPPCSGWLGPYEIREILGRGGMGVVLKAFDPSLHRLVALKVLAPHLADSLAARKRFAREGRAAAAVNHEHVVTVHAVQESDGLPYLVMEYVPGISLQERLDRDGPLDLRSVVRLGMQTAAGLAAAHARGLIHRDIKPANILLENGSDRVKITDFGLARAADDASLTCSNVIAGTPLYMSPEQARGESVDARTDLFSLGSVLYTACTGRPPFRAPSAVAVLHRICTDEPLALAAIKPDIPEWLCDFIAVLHAKDRAGRIATAEEAAMLLGQYLMHLEEPGRQPHPPRLARRPIRSQSRQKPPQRRLLALASVLLVAATLIGGFFRLSSAPNGPSTQPSVARLLTPRRHLEHPAPVLVAVFAPRGNLLATACQDRAVRLWNVRTGKLLRELTGHRHCVWSVTFSPDGRFLASAAGEWGQSAPSGELRLWDAATGEMLRSLNDSSETIFSVAFSPDGNILASAGWGGHVRLWDIETGEQMGVLRGHTAAIRSLTFAPRGRTLASAGFDGSVKLWDLATGECIATLSDPEYRINAIDFSPDGKLLAAAENPRNEPAAARVGRVKVWDLRTHQKRAVLEGYRGSVLSVRFSPDGKTLLTGGGDWSRFGEVFVWDTSTWSQPVRLPGYRAWVESLAFSPDGRWIASSGGAAPGKGEVKLWDWRAGLR